MVSTSASPATFVLELPPVAAEPAHKPAGGNGASTNGAPEHAEHKADTPLVFSFDASGAVVTSADQAPAKHHDAAGTNGNGRAAPKATSDASAANPATHAAPAPEVPAATDASFFPKAEAPADAKAEAPKAKAKAKAKAAPQPPAPPEKVLAAPSSSIPFAPPQVRPPAQPARASTHAPAALTPLHAHVRTARPSLHRTPRHGTRNAGPLHSRSPIPAARAIPHPPVAQAPQGSPRFSACERNLLLRRTPTSSR